VTVENATSVIIENATIQPAGQEWTAYVVLGATVVLAIITGLYMRETRKMRKATENMVAEAANTRKASQQPIFAVQPSNYLGVLNEPPGENFRKLNLVNHGAPATDIIAEYAWLDQEGGGGSSRTTYIISLAKDGYAALDIPELEVVKIVKQRQFLQVKIKCKDAAGNDYSKVITNGLDKIRDKNIKIAYQNNNWQIIYDALDRIYHTLNTKLK
jgi:hypothetical protein